MAQRGRTDAEGVPRGHLASHPPAGSRRAPSRWATSRTRSRTCDLLELEPAARSVFYELLGWDPGRARSRSSPERAGRADRSRPGRGALTACAWPPTHRTRSRPRCCAGIGRRAAVRRVRRTSAESAHGPRFLEAGGRRLALVPRPTRPGPRPVRAPAREPGRARGRAGRPARRHWSPRTASRWTAADRRCLAAARRVRRDLPAQQPRPARRHRAGAPSCSRRASACCLGTDSLASADTPRPHGRHGAPAVAVPRAVAPRSSCGWRRSVGRRPWVSTTWARSSRDAARPSRSCRVHAALRPAAFPPRQAPRRRGPLPA